MKRTREEFAKIIYDDLFGVYATLHPELKADDFVKRLNAVSLVVAEAFERWPWDYGILQNRYKKYHCEGCGKYYNCECADEKQADTETVLDMLCLIECKPVPKEVVDGWTQEQKNEVCDYVGAIHLSAADNPDVEIPPKPECLKPYRDWAF